PQVTPQGHAPRPDSGSGPDSRRVRRSSLERTPSNMPLQTDQQQQGSLTFVAVWRHTVSAGSNPVSAVAGPERRSAGRYRVIDHSDELEKIVVATGWLRRALHLVREAGPPGAFIAAGAIRELVWNTLTGKSTAAPSADVDVIYFDSTEASDCPAKYESRLSTADPSKDWEVTNQAFVHRWLPRGSEPEASPFECLLDGVRSWPEVATAVAVRIRPNDKLEVLAPFGLGDLFNLVVRPNGQCANPYAYRERVLDKDWARRWPELKIEPVRGAPEQGVADGPATARVS
ncbi:MAG: nucleotidyltransferase family protein, partial [Pirellulaceae bacterium]